ncbi:MAG: ABC transporter permease subunit [Bacillota bacterium]
MQEKMKFVVKRVGIPRAFIIGFLAVLFVGAVYYDMPLSSLFSDILVRLGMNGILVLAMVPSVLSGTGLNFGIPLGIICGIIGGLVSIEMDLRGFQALSVAMLISIPMSVAMGYLYGLLLNKVKGDEMTVATYVGFSAASLMCIGWLFLPFRSPEMVFAIEGKGLRNTITLSGRFDKILDHFLEIQIGGLHIPTGSILFFLLCCFLMWLFLRSRTGLAMKTVGENQRFAVASGLSVDKARLIGTIISTVLGGIGIIVYAQSYGFFQLYQAPLMMAFPPVAAILIGGASTKNAKISHVIIGTLLFQALLIVALPVANKMVPEGNLSEVARVIVSYGFILYALTQAGGGE